MLDKITSCVLLVLYLQKAFSPYLSVQISTEKVIFACFLNILSAILTGVLNLEDLEVWKYYIAFFLHTKLISNANIFLLLVSKLMLKIISWIFQDILKVPFIGNLKNFENMLKDVVLLILILHAKLVF